MTHRVVLYRVISSKTPISIPLGALIIPLIAYLLTTSSDPPRTNTGNITAWALEL